MTIIDSQSAVNQCKIADCTRLLISLSLNNVFMGFIYDFTEPCLKHTVSKGLGIGIIAGSVLGESK